MSLSERVNSDLKAALLSGNRFKVDLLRCLKAAILDEEVRSKKRDTGLEDSEVEKIVAQEVKKRRESVRLYEQAGRTELSQSEEKEAEILSEYLPKQLSEEEILITVKQIMSELKIQDVSQMGRIIGATKSRLGNAADGSTIANVVKKALI